MSDWNAIWANRSGDGHQLEDLLRLNGFDSGAGYVDSDNWLSFISSIADECGISSGDRILELGCGAGAFLKGLQEVIGGLQLSGVDYSRALLEKAREAIPDAIFFEADLRTHEILAEYDVVISHSVFQYLDEEAARRVVRNSLEKAKKTVAILDIPNLSTRQASEAARKAELGEKEYGKKYLGLSHTYFEKELFESLRKDDWQVSEAESTIAEYLNKDFRFSVVFRRVILDSYSDKIQVGKA